MRPSKRTIFVTFEKEGIHKYPSAATDPTLATGDWDDVSFLANEHRHVFKFRVDIDVRHSGREIEFIQFKRWLIRLYDEGPLRLDEKSCEAMAEDLAVRITERYPKRFLRIAVSEDGENGAVLEWNSVPETATP